MTHSNVKGFIPLVTNNLNKTAIIYPVDLAKPKKIDLLIAITIECKFCRVKY